MHHRAPLLILVLAGLSSSRLHAAPQVDYDGDGRPWNQRAESGPDAEVPGWFYNLGITGLRVRLDGRAPTQLVVEYVFPDSPADGKVRAGDRILGAGGAAFETPHQDGYGMEVFGPTGPIQDFATALDAALTSRKLTLTVESDATGSGSTDLVLRLPRSARPYAATFPYDCKQVRRVREGLLDELVERQKEDGSWGNPVHDTFAPLALLSSRTRSHLAAAKKSARYHARTTSAEDDGGLVNWRYMAAAIVLAEYALVTGEDWALPELREIATFLEASQFMRAGQIDPKVRQSHPDAYPRNDTQQRGGWGHNVGFEGYGPIAMLTGQGALALELMRRAGVDVDPERHRAAYDFLARGTGRNGYLWYADEVANDDGWADMGRTGASGIAHWLSPFDGHRDVALRHAKLIGEQPESFPDTHGSPLMGMAYAALAAHADRPSFERLMRANRWWFVLAECPDGTFHYQPNRDNAGYGSDARLCATAVTAFLLSVHERKLVITGSGSK